MAEEKAKEFIQLSGRKHQLAAFRVAQVESFEVNAKRELVIVMRSGRVVNVPPAQAQGGLRALEAAFAGAIEVVPLPEPEKEADVVSSPAPAREVTRQPGAGGRVQR